MTTAPRSSRRLVEEIRVLHVDDNPDFVDMAATFIEREDARFGVETATSAESGLDRLATGQFDCVVSDYDMPRTNGIEFLEAVREADPDLPFILYTGKGSEEVASDAISAGVTDYLQKETGSSQYAVLTNRIANAAEQYWAKRGIEASQERLSLFFDESPLGVIEWTVDGEFERINGTAEEILGYRESELLGASWKTIVPESERERIGDVVTKLLEAEGGYHSVNENVRREGERVVCEWHNRVVTDDAGDAVTIFSQFRDVTERAERKRELERYEAYLEGSSDIITVLDESGVVKYESPSVARILGYDQGQLIGESGFDRVHPDDVDRVYESFVDLVADPKATVTVECRFRTAGGEWRWLEVHGTNQLDNDAVNGVITNSRDITDRKARERELERTSDLLEKTECNADVGGWEIDTDTMDVFWSETLFDILGVDADEEPPLEEALDVYHEDDRATVADAVEAALEDGEPFDVRVRFRRPDAEIRWLRVQGVPATEDGTVVTLRGAVQDITDQKRYERELEGQNERLEEFAGLVSHDLRNPLQLADGRLELAWAECESDHLATIDDALSRMDRIIEDVLWLAREGRDIGSTGAHDLEEIVRSAWSFTAGAGEARLTIADDLGTAEADDDRLRQLLENLFRNAVEHGSTSPRSQAPDDAAGARSSESPVADGPDVAGDGGDTVEVTVGSLPGGFYVEDDGPGIPEAIRDDVFTTGYSTGAGTGFGLSIVRRVATAHDWTVRVTDGATGGARFEITGVEFDG